MATLYSFAGLPAAGKSALAQMLATRLGAVYLRIDTVEQSLRRLYAVDVEESGYLLSHDIAADNLRLGNSVVADSCNPIRITRAAWRQVALDSGATCVDIEVRCSDAAEHRRRVESRRSSVPGLVLPTWVEVQARTYETWKRPRLVIDTASTTPKAAFDVLLGLVSKAASSS